MHKEKESEIKISLTEFLNYVNKSGSAKVTVVKNAIKSREEKYKNYADYWSPFRKKLISYLKNEDDVSTINELLEEIPTEKKTNYIAAIEGFKLYAKKKKFKWMNPPKKTWIAGNLRISLNPELGIEYKNKIYVIKLFFPDESLDKKHADLILALMEKELRSKVGGDEVIFSVLNVRKGKPFEKKIQIQPFYHYLKPKP